MIRLASFPRVLAAAAVAAAFLAVPSTAQVAAPVLVRPAPRPSPAPPVTSPRTVLFIGNSFTQGANSPVRSWRPGSVHDLNGAGIGGVPALFKAFTQAVGQSWDVSLETQGGKTLGFHFDERRQLFDRRWDAVVLQEYSTLDPDRPGDPTRYLADVDRLAALFAARNPAVRIELMATWARADLVYRAGGSPWSGRSVERMAADLRAAADSARTRNPRIAGVLPVGQAWNRAIAMGIADPNPYDGVAPDQIDLWTWDHYHASAAGYYLEALVVFGRLTGVDPTTLGADELAAGELGLSPATAAALQRVARDQLAAG